MIIVYLLVFISLFIYSYSQVDLNLTLLSQPIYLQLQTILTNLGFYQRPVSAFLFLLILGLLFILYFRSLYLAGKNQFSQKKLIILTGLTSLLIFSYPSFSHDMFNYIFDARIVTKYQLNPYFFKALDFPQDEWTRFMRWTHRYFPYGPVWLFISLAPSFLGVGKFILTLFSFKLMMFLFFVGCGSLIYKISQKLNSKQSLISAVAFLLNPLVIIESVVSPHNEIVMLFFALLSIYLLILNKKFISSISLVFSIGIKFLSIILLPVLFVTKINWELRLKILFYLWLAAIIPLVILRETYSWYFVPIIGFGSLVIHDRLIRSFMMALSIGVLVRYLPYLYYGDYSVSTISLQNLLMMVIGVASGIIVFILWRGVEKSANKFGRSLDFARDD